MKIKQFISNTDNDIDNKVNEFMADKKIIDVKLATANWERVVLVMYEDKDGVEDDESNGND